MALFHFTVTQTKRSKGQSAIASAAYRSGEKLYSEYYGEYSDYTRKRGVICSDILLPPHAPKEYADRQTLWNAVEKAERGKNAQLAYSFEISLQNEFSLEENIALAREFLFREFVSRGMTVDVSFHEKECEDGGTPNPHFHFLCPIRPMEQDGTWGIKQRREYVLDEEGNRIRDANGKRGDGKNSAHHENLPRKYAEGAGRLQGRHGKGLSDTGVPESGNGGGKRQPSAGFGCTALYTGGWNMGMYPPFRYRAEAEILHRREGGWSAGGTG